MTTKLVKLLSHPLESMAMEPSTAQNDRPPAPPAPPAVILASSSPFRRNLMRLHFPDLFYSQAVAFLTPEVDERAIGRDLEPEAMCQKVAEAKMDWILANKEAELVGAQILITCDMVVKYRGQALEKPTSDIEARAFLQNYRDHPSEPVFCINGIVLRDLTLGLQESVVEVSSLFFLPFGDEAIQEMIEDGSALQMAGAFSMDHPAMGKYITGLNGSPTAVEGLPVELLRQKLMAWQPSLPCQLKILGAIKCVIFDMDGLILDTERWYSLAQQQILDRFEIKFTYDVKAKIMGRKSLDAANVMIDHYGLKGRLDPEEFIREREEILDQMFPKSEIMAGVQRLLVHLRKNNVPMAIATSSHIRHYTIKTQLHGELFGKVFHHVVTGDQVKESKPHPEIFLKALDQFHRKDISPQEVLVLEDAPLGVLAAQRAKMNVVQVSSVESAEVKPNQLIPTMWHFCPEQWGLPKFD
ncbi:hypothetical protein TCAL_00315 [Tigriopus californicus]|uniref:Uncharacterized protein n=1 Tax=Tigriopus californicus TaxID=6832 RepID=A0A553NEV8_TIGCA|nr:uncharacterized protein LOC131888817 [Tigriopus californicus]TRY63961.1 hypothetical protein TCAL_00315 [Tigriopus californicus]|eukprot:TCALIF_00315-PA protein Name:"Similar to GPP2 (DL)-glycerol-3-phosphatase 2 (Arabidopsis thaliana)" AED:0.31 eAED:0.31 QI:0/-1/0/1/-1/1/1/0/468